ncbi:MAG: hypothetical protein ACK4SF_05920 [Algoriphagus aquaeductus]|uniref:hypothetical protein n=1 Tax=Algoriphagus aquaeductus TaxID=475299 RepID=UPI00391B8C95
MENKYDHIIQLFKEGQIKSAPVKKACLGVCSIYDKIRHPWYKGVAASFVFQFDQGFINWAIKDHPDFCIKEYDYLHLIKTVNKRVYEMREITHETRAYYKELSEILSDEEILVAIGSETFQLDEDAQEINQKKLDALGIKPEPPRMMDRAYFSYHLNLFPQLHGEWIFEGFRKSDKDSSTILLLKRSSENKDNRGFQGERVGIFDINNLYFLFDENEAPISDRTSIEVGTKFTHHHDFHETVKYLLVKSL